MRDVHGKPLIYIVSTFASATLHTQRNSGSRQMVTPQTVLGSPICLILEFLMLFQSHSSFIQSIHFIRLSLSEKSLFSYITSSFELNEQGDATNRCSCNCGF